MGDPVSTAVIAEAVAPEVASAVGMSELAGAGAIVNPFTSAMTTGMTAGGYGAGGESLFGFDPSISGFGQGVMESLGSANKFMNANPVTSQLGMKAVGGLMQQQQQPHYAPAGQIHRGQIQPADYMSLLNPQGQSVMRPQPISLL
jgi:hypothetical protein